MPWRRFLLWNALGGIAWASTVGAVAYVLGRSASGSLGAIGIAGLGIAVLAYLAGRLRDNLRARPPEEPAGRTPARPKRLPRRPSESLRSRPTGALAPASAPGCPLGGAGQVADVELVEGELEDRVRVSRVLDAVPEHVG